MQIIQYTALKISNQIIPINKIRTYQDRDQSPTLIEYLINK